MKNYYCKHGKSYFRDVCEDCRRDIKLNYIETELKELLKEFRFELKNKTGVLLDKFQMNRIYRIIQNK